MDHAAASWTAPLPAPFEHSYCCWDEQTDAYVKDPAASHYADDWPHLMVGGAVVFEDEGCLLVLDAGDGHTVFTWTDTRTRDQRGDSQYEGVTDVGKVTIRDGADSCTSEVLGQSFVRACGARLVMFDRGLLTLFDRKPAYRLVATQPVRGPGLDFTSPRDPSHVSGEIRTAVDQTETVGGVKVRFEGVRITAWIR